MNILQQIQTQVQERGKSPCMHYKKAETWHLLSWEEMWKQVMAMARGLMAQGVRPGDRIAIFASTRLEWTLADVASLAVGAIVVPIYVNLSRERIEFILKHAGVTHIFVENQALADRLPTTYVTERRLFFMDSVSEPSSVAALCASGASIAEREVSERIDALRRESVASYIYTSGTTGEQKGAIISHGNIAAEIEATRKVYHFAADDIGLLCLPLPHVFARMVQFFHLVEGCQTAYAESLEKLADSFQEIRPHFVAGVPRMLEKIHERILQTVSQQSSWKQRLFRWGIKIGSQSLEMERHHRKVAWTFRWRFLLARELVFKSILNRLGGRLKIFISGGAPLSREIGWFFSSIGLQVFEGYGLTETFAAVIVNNPQDYRLGTVGKPLPGVRISLASDGEVLIKGPMVFSGYLNAPKQTAEVYDAEGWFHSGDIGEYSKEGYLRIVDRKKDLIVTSGGKKIAPQSIEKLLEASPFIDTAFLYGDGKKFLTALLVVKEMAELPIAQHVDAVNLQLSHFETIKKYTLLTKPFSVESGELTPTLKLRRREIAKKYHDLLEKMYASDHEESVAPRRKFL